MKALMSMLIVACTSAANQVILAFGLSALSPLVCVGAASVSDTGLRR